VEGRAAAAQELWWFRDVDLRRSRRS